MSRAVVDKGHRIRAAAVQVGDAEDGTWVAEAMIRVPLQGGGRDQPLPDPDNRSFATEEDADSYAVHPAMRGVERHGR